MKAQTFNEIFPVGSPVIYVDDFGTEHHTKTRSEAWETGSGNIIVKIEGRTGGFDIARIKPIASGNAEFTHKDLENLVELIEKAASNQHKTATPANNNESDIIDFGDQTNE